MSRATVLADPTNETDCAPSIRLGSNPTTSFSHSRLGGGSAMGIPARRLANACRPDEASNRASSSVVAATMLTPRITCGGSSCADGWKGGREISPAGINLLAAKGGGDADGQPE